MTVCTIDAPIPLLKLADIGIVCRRVAGPLHYVEYLGLQRNLWVSFDRFCGSEEYGAACRRSCFLRSRRPGRLIAAPGPRLAFLCVPQRAARAERHA